MSRRRKSGPTLPMMLLIVCIGLAGVIYQGIGAVSQPQAINAADSGPTRALPALPAELRFAMAPMEDFVEVVERPMFSATRRPPSPEAAAASASAAEAVVEELDLVLKGIIVSARGRIVMLSETSGGGTVTLTQGQQHKGWTLAEIQPEQVTFRRDGLERELALQYDVAPVVRKPTRKSRRQSKRRETKEQSAKDKKGKRRKAGN